MKNQLIDTNREQTFKKAAEEMANKFKEKISKEKEKNKKLNELNLSMNQELARMKGDNSV